MSIFQDWGLMKKKEEEPVEAKKPVITQPTVTSFGGQFQASPAFHQPTVGSKTDYNQYLEEVLQKHNQPGFDWLEFNKTLTGMANKPLAEQQKYETANIAAESMEVKPDALIQSGQRYLQILTQEGTDFEADMAKAYEAKVTAKELEIQRLAEKNAELAKQIEQNNQNSQQLNMEVLESKNVLGSEKQAFEYALNNKKAVINDTLSKIQLYLNGTTK